MLSSVLNSERAIHVNIEIMRAFVRLRQMLASNAELSRRLDELESKYDRQFKVVFDPTRRQVLGVKSEGQLGDLTLGGIFFESREPPNSEFSIADLMAAFPEGRYEVRGTSFDGRGLTGFATFTHDIPAAPTITSPLEDAVVSINNLAVEWNDVTQTIDGRPVTITGYEVIITKF